MISQKKALQLERDYRGILYRRPFGIFSVLMLIAVSVFSLGIALSSTKIRFPFYSIYVATFSLLIIAIAVPWLLLSIALLKKRDWSGVVMGGIGFVAIYFGFRLLHTCVSAFSTQ